MAEKIVSESDAVGRTLDESGNVGHNKALLPVADDAEVGRKRGEVIVGHLGTRGRDTREQRGLSDVRIADEAHVRQHFQFERKIAFLSRAAAARKPRDPDGWR